MTPGARVCLGTSGLVLVMLGAAESARGQLLSPGRLASDHAGVEGIRNCTSCHRLGTAGVSADRCLDCHEPLATRIRGKDGYHATVATGDCAECHPDHLGPDFDLVRLDEAAFDHDATAYTLEASHRDAACRDCHRSENVVAQEVRTWMAPRRALDRTFLGLSGECESCHGADEPHGGQFTGRRCADCHDEGSWTEPVRFEHDRSSYPLDGEHLGVACKGCHAREESGLRWRPVPSESCADCHAPSPHGSGVQGDCESCHSTRGWLVVSSDAVRRGFDHAATRFPLQGAHATVDCSRCHEPGGSARGGLLRISLEPGPGVAGYPRPVVQGCASCHVDRHAASPTRDGPRACADCHGEEAWSPGSFGVERHETSSFPLDGAHIATPCVSCHVQGETMQPTFLLTLDIRRCADCHLTDEDHRDAYATAECEACHQTVAFDVVELEHEGLTAACVSCHGADDPHARQFGEESCGDCHGTDSFAGWTADHDSTDFPLDGAHRSSACVDCHRSESGPDGPYVRYRPTGTDCSDCHGGDR